MNGLKEKPKLKGVSETMLIPLRARHLETQKANGIIKDPKSTKILEQIDYDFSGEKEVSTGSQIGVAIRTEILDEGTLEFLSRNPEAVVVNLGCGLDTRFHRLDNKQLIWFDLDMPEAIQLRKNFFEETDRFKFISKSALDFSWLDEIPTDKPILFLAEGLFMYFQENEIKNFLREVKVKFPNAEILLEAMSPFMVKCSAQHPDLKGYDASFKWGIKTGEDFNSWDIGVKFIKEWYYFDRHRDSYPLMFKILSLFPSFRKSMKIIHIEFSS